MNNNWELAHLQWQLITCTGGTIGEFSKQPYSILLFERSPPNADSAQHLSGVMKMLELGSGDTYITL